MALDPMTIATIVGAAGPLLGGVLGNQAAAGDRDRALGISSDLYSRIAGLQAPDIEKLRLALEEYQTVGQLSPESEVAQQLSQGTAFEDISLDPRLRQAQLDQLSSLEKLGQTSFSPEEQAQLNTLRRQVEGENQSRMQDLLENQQARGVASGEGALAARMIASQSAANRQAAGADELAAQAFRRALEAKAGAAGLAGNIESADYSRGANVAQALDTRELQNLQQRAGTQQRNIDRFNEAQQMNLSARQATSDKNVGLRNEQQQYNRELEQRRFDNELKRAGVLTGSAANLSEEYKDRARSTQNMYGSVGEGLGAIAGAAGQLFKKQAPQAAAPNTAMSTDPDKVFAMGGGMFAK